jgi:hypothetical protein
MTRSATQPDGALPPAAPPLASQRAPEGDPAPPTVSSPALAPPAAAQPTAAQPTAAAQPAPARPHSIRYAGSGSAGRADDEPSAAESAAEPGPTATEPDGPHDDYWDGDDAGQFAGLVYPARGGDPGSAAAAAASRSDDSDRTQPVEVIDDHTAGGPDDAEAGGSASRREPVEIDEDAPPFATAPFATVPRLNRVRSMPVPPEDDEAE